MPLVPTSPSNRRIVLARRPHGLVTEQDFRQEVVELPDPPPGEALVRNLYLSLDPAMRGWMDEGDTYVPAIGIGEVVRCGGVGEVVVSNTEGLVSGDLVSGVLGWQDYALVTTRGPRGVSKLQPGIDPTMAMSVLGITGLTAWFGLFDIGRPEPGETVVVSGAAGATGSVAAQLAKAHGARVVGIAGGPEKCAWLRSLGLDEAVDYRHDLRSQLESACPDGVDVFFDNVGGEILEAVLHRIRDRARIVMCGAISGYNDTVPTPGPRNLSQLIIHRARIEGFIVFDYARRFPEAQADLTRRITSGELQWKVDIVEGLEEAPMAMNRLFSGGNTGKLLVKLGDPS